MAEQYASLLWRRTPLLCERFELIFLEPACSPIEQQGGNVYPSSLLAFQTNGKPRMVVDLCHDMKSLVTYFMSLAIFTKVGQA